MDVYINVTPKLIKLLKENIRANLCYFRLDKDFLDMIPRAQFTKEQIDKLDLPKLKVLFKKQY